MTERDSVACIEGKRPVLEAIRSGYPIEEVLIADNLERDDLIKDILRKAKAAGIPVREASRKRIEEMSAKGLRASGESRGKQGRGSAPERANQGVIARAGEFPYQGINELIGAANADFERADARALVVVCDHLTDAGNLGAIARSAEAVGASGIVIPNKRSAHVTPATFKSSAGAIAHMRVAQVANIVSALERLKDNGFWVVAATEHADSLVWDTNMEGKMALVMGNEQTGVSNLVLEHSDLLCKLPQMGRISSLNVAQASTALMYEWLRQNIAR